MVPLVLLFHIAQSIQRTTLVEFINGDQVGKIEHVDLFKLAGCAIFRGHDIERDIAVVNDLGIGLPDARSFNNHHVKSCHFSNIDGIAHIFRKRQV